MVSPRRHLHLQMHTTSSTLVSPRQAASHLFLQAASRPRVPSQVLQEPIRSRSPMANMPTSFFLKVCPEASSLQLVLTASITRWKVFRTFRSSSSQLRPQSVVCPMMCSVSPTRRLHRLTQSQSKHLSYGR